MLTLSTQAETEEAQNLDCLLQTSGPRSADPCSSGSGAWGPT